MEIIATFLNKLMNLQLPVIVPCFIATSLLTFNPFGLLEKLGLVEFQHQYQKWISFVFLYCVSCLLYLSGAKILSAIGRGRRKSRIKKKLREQMLNLSKGELEILGFLYHSPNGSEWLPFEHPPVLSLHSKGLIEYTISNVMARKELNYALCVACILAPLVSEALKESLANSQDPSTEAAASR